MRPNHVARHYTAQMTPVSLTASLGESAIHPAVPHTLAGTLPLWKWTQ